MELPHTIVGIDVETTALEPSEGEIIDVAAIRYDLATGQEIDRLTRLARPGRPITAEITALTGITQAMVENEQPFSTLIADLKEFISDDILFAHNASFDLKWLDYHGLSLDNPTWDTFLLATIAWPEVQSYNLGMLAALFNLDVVAEHRAAADVVLTWHLLQHLRPTLTVSSATYQHIQTLLTKASLGHYLPLFLERSGPGQQQAHGSQVPSKPRKRHSSAQPPIAAIKEILGEDGLLEGHLPGFSSRPPQVLMATTIDRWVREGKVGFIEAATGTGKTYGYVVTGLHALGQHRPLIISTYTRHLQDQLVEKDIPKVLTALGLPYQVAVLKGRRNYICNARLKQVLDRPTWSSTEAIIMIKILKWLDDGGSGELERLNVSHQGSSLTRWLHADALSCRTYCTYASGCPYQLARARAAQADIIVVNHALLLQMAFQEPNPESDAWGEAAGSHHSIIIIDEAHHLEEAARHASMLDLTPERVAEAIAPLLHLTKGRLEESRHRHLAQECEILLQEYGGWLREVGQIVIQQSHNDRLLLGAAVRRGAGWQKVARAADIWRGRLKFITGLARSLESKQGATPPTTLAEALAELERLAIEFGTFIEGSSERIQWVEIIRDVASGALLKVTLKDTALSVQPIVQAIFSNAHSVILTSATLSIGGSFSYIKERLGVESAEELQLPSPFDYRNKMLIYLVDDAPHPGDKEYDAYVADTMLQITNAIQGRVLGLFTSQKGVRSVYNRLIRHLHKAKIKLYAQKITGGRTNMLERFRKIPRSVLLGTMSFWEGVDVVGESLSCVVIPKVPFPPPDDPVITAIATAEQVHAFTALSVPTMILQLRQGVGRLLRSIDDQGVVVILDSRLGAHDYGDEVLKSLPPATIHIGSGSDLIPTLTSWFGEKTLARWRSEI
ncbi:MAG: helicase C-terminal domain-containing protein [Candidatus Andersenbacteria bacterium]